jgi:hypothetical protein
LSVPLWPAGVGAGTYYLAPAGDDRQGDGSRRRPWKTILHATSRVPDDGSTIVLFDGLYVGRQSINRQFSRLCTVRAEHPYRARLRSPEGQNRLLHCYHGSNVRFQGLEMFGSGGTRGEYLLHISTPETYRLLFEDCIIHDCYNNDMIKINNRAHHIIFRGCAFFNPANREGVEHFDINTVTDVRVEDSIFFQDYAGSGRRGANRSHSFVVVKNSGSTPDVTKRIAFRRNIFLNWEGKTDQAYLLLGEDGKPFFEAQEVMIENNLFIYNSSVRFWGALLYKGGLKNITFRANTVVGNPVIKWSGAFAAVCLRIGKNPPMGDLTFCNNIWCDPTGKMPRFTISRAEVFAPDAKLVLRNNLYWNGGKPIPTEPQDTLVPDRDPARRIADPRLGDPGKGVTLPRWDPVKGTFRSGKKTIRGEFERLVNRYAALGSGSRAINAADASCMPRDDILGTPRDRLPDIGCFERKSQK